jgi:hypothetical protein
VVRFRAAGAAAALIWIVLGAAPAVAAPHPTPPPTHAATPVHSGGRLAGGLPGIDGRVVALGSVLGLGLLVGVLGVRRD